MLWNLCSLKVSLSQIIQGSSSVTVQSTRVQVLFLNETFVSGFLSVVTEDKEMQRRTKGRDLNRVSDTNLWLLGIPVHKPFWMLVREMGVSCLKTLLLGKDRRTDVLEFLSSSASAILESVTELQTATSPQQKYSYLFFEYRYHIEILQSLAYMCSLIRTSKNKLKKTEPKLKYITTELLSRNTYWKLSHNFCYSLLYFVFDSAPCINLFTDFVGRKSPRNKVSLSWLHITPSPPPTLGIYFCFSQRSTYGSVRPSFNCHVKLTSYWK